MKFTQIFKDTIGLWPEKILISDGKNIVKDGGYFLTLGKAWDEAELKAQSLSSWQQLMVWAIFGGLHDQALSSYKNKENENFRKNINLENVERIFAENLISDDGGYGEMKSQYINDM